MSRYLVFLATLAFLMWSIDSDKTLSASELIQAYCKLVRNKKVHRDFRLQDLCALHVKIFNDKVRMATISFLWQYRQCRWNLLIFITLVSIFTNIYHFWLIFHEILLQFQENYSNFSQILLIFVKFHEILLQFQENYSNVGQFKVKFHAILLYFYENYSHLRSKCVKIHTFFIKLGQFLLIFDNVR